jgi:anti-anti-sigma factor
MATAPALWAAIRPALRAGQELLLDCANLTFVDARGLAVLMRATRQAVASGATFVITNLARQPRHVIDLAGLRDVLPVRWLPRPHVPAAS